MRGFASSFIDRLSGWGGWLIAVLLIAQVVIVALRYVFALGWSWATDLMTYLFLLSVLLPGLMVIVSNASVRVDVFYAGWSARRRTLVDRAALLLLLFPAMAYAAWASLGPTLISWAILESSPTFGGLPGYFILKTALTAFFGSIALAALIMGLSRSPYPTELSDES